MSTTTEKIQEIGSRVVSLKNSSAYVRDYSALTKELRHMKKSIETMPENTIFVMRKAYISLLEEKMEELKTIDDVKKYIAICDEFSAITDETSSSMKSLKRKNPELYSWIAMNQKRAIFEKLVEEEPQRYAEHSKILEAVKRNIKEFHRQHKESVDEWEKLYNMKHLIRTLLE